jgi:hypothetical protein
MSQSKQDQQEPVLRHLIDEYEQALTARNYPEADALHMAIQRAVKVRPPARPGSAPSSGVNSCASFPGSGLLLRDRGQ